MNSCPFCDYEGPSPIIDQTEFTYIIQPLKPVVPRHLLVIPWRHVEDFAEDPVLSAYVMENAAAWIKEKDPFKDYNLITSKGPAATQSVSHLHVHLVPRRVDDGLMLPWSDA